LIVKGFKKYSGDSIPKLKLNSFVMHYISIDKPGMESLGIKDGVP
jgi:hypothetical protein